MTWIKNTGSKYHTQDTNYYCGAASAMVVLAEIGVPYSGLDQDDLYDSNHSHNAKTGWATDPVGLCWTMVNTKPSTFTNTFVVYKKATEAEGSQKLVDTLLQFGVSPIVLVYGCMHWITVVGVQTNVNPSTGPYTIEGFWINNSVHKDNEPHSATDACGTGGADGVENQWVSYATWQSTYFTGCNYDSADGSRQFISVCDPQIPKIGVPQQIATIRYFDGKKIAGESKIHNVLKRELARLSLGTEKLTARVANATFAKPLLVQRLDLDNSYYYLIPSIEKNKIIGFSQVNALFGNIESVYTLRKSITPFEIEVPKIEKKIAGLKLELPDSAGRILLKKGIFRIEKSLYWKPCRESFSPNLPFWKIVLGKHTFYQRIDGPIFTQLTVDGKGV